MGGMTRSTCKSTRTASSVLTTSSANASHSSSHVDSRSGDAAPGGQSQWEGTLAEHQCWDRAAEGTDPGEWLTSGALSRVRAWDRGPSKPSRCCGSGRRRASAGVGA